MKKILKFLNDYLEETICIILMSVMTIIIFIQVIMRYVMHNSLSWSEELARYCFIWLIYIGVAYGCKLMKHIKIDAALKLFPEKVRPYITIVGELLVLAFAAYIVVTGVELTYKQWLFGKASEVFEKWLDENASEYLTEDEMKDLKEKINAMTADVDFLNAQEGYRGTSYESVFLLSASEAGLRKVNEMYVPEQFQAGFSDMIDEYVHFNDSARNSIMEKMTPDYMVVGIGSKTESYKYKSEIISDETAFYTNEKKEISGICNQFLNGKTDQKLFCNEMKDRLNDYYGSRYELRNQPEAVEGRVNNMLDKLQHMFGV